MALGSRKGKALSKAEILKAADEQDQRRQEQIRRQTQIIDWLLTENQMMMGLLGELQATDERAGEILANIESLREADRKKEKKRG